MSISFEFVHGNIIFNARIRWMCVCTVIFYATTIKVSRRRNAWEEFLDMLATRNMYIWSVVFVFHGFGLFVFVFSCVLCNVPSNQVFISSCRPISDVSSDLTVEVGTSSFSLHKVRKTFGSD